ncbi:DNA replication/repair protein RecF [Risungbinella massiliensis]|uniref:DNA replication/repair protein RecF n=1 Tax=Risungbinella massiliensis TaxID=1329796 RepID=UPI0005CB9BEF|nr:DNA replication/repair protein RecF [Risungbinella massiliensis]
MRLQELEISQYRNIGLLTLTCPEELHLFVGENAQGKTNIVESLYVLSLAKSHRTRATKDLIQFGKPFSKLKAKVKKGDQLIRLEVQLNEKGKKAIRNGLEQPKLSHYIGTMPTILFAPEDLAIVKGSPQIRRRFLDTEIGQVSPTYLYQLNQIQKVLHQRNAILKNGMQKELLEVLNEQFLSLSIQIWKKRYYFIDLLLKWAQPIHETITGGKECLQIEYLPSVPIQREMDEDQIRAITTRELARLESQEWRRGSTLIGPQRDDFRLKNGELDLHNFGSQGQQRTAALSLKLAEIELIYQETGFYPLLLLDDVLSELDDHRKTQLLEAIRGKVQTFVTTTSLEGIHQDTLQRAKIYRVEQGNVTVQG